MTVVEIGVASIAAMLAELKGNEKTRPFTRKVWWAIVLLDAGVSAGGIASWMGDAAAVVGGLV